MSLLNSRTSSLTDGSLPHELTSPLLSIVIALGMSLFKKTKRIRLFHDIFPWKLRDIGRRNLRRNKTYIYVLHMVITIPDGDIATTGASCMYHWQQREMPCRRQWRTYMYNFHSHYHDCWGPCYTRHPCIKSNYIGPVFWLFCWSYMRI